MTQRESHILREQEEIYKQLIKEHEEIESKISDMEWNLRELGAYWILYKPDYTGKVLTCDKCWSGVNQDKEKCKPCPSYKQRFLLTKSDIAKINDKFIFASR